jgi:hypothetical protein
MRKALLAWIAALGLLVLLAGMALADVWTDKADYAPGETVYIYGNGMEPG